MLLQTSPVLLETLPPPPRAISIAEFNSVVLEHHMKWGPLLVGGDEVSRKIGGRHLKDCASWRRPMKAGRGIC